MNNKSLLIERVYKLKLTQRATLVAFYLSAPSMGDNLAVKVRCGLGSGNH